MKTTDVCKRTKYEGYKSFDYLEPGTDYREFKLAKELDRVPSRKVDVNDSQEERVWRLLDQNLAVSLHDHCFIVPEDFGDLAEYRRQGRDFTGYAGMAQSGLDAATAIENEVDRLDILYGLGIRSSGIAYSEANTLGSGLREARDGGLTEFGRQAVRRMNKLGIAIDISHSGDQTSLDTIETSDKPIFATHAGARGLWNTKRMKPDEVLKALAAKGGVIGIEAAPHTTLTKKHPKHSIESFMEHFEYCADLMGIDHVAFGPDTLFGDHVGLHHYFAKQLSISAARGQVQFDEVEFVDGIENPAEAFPNIVRWMVKHDYSDGDIAKAIGGNVMRVLEEAWFR